MATLAERVVATVQACLYDDAEVKDGQPADAVLVEGVTHNFGFNPKRLAAHRAEIDALIEEIVPTDFYEDSKARGASFLALAHTRTGELWAEHRTMESLFVLAAAAGRARILLPRSLWYLAPGGMPFLQFAPVSGFRTKVAR